MIMMDSPFSIGLEVLIVLLCVSLVICFVRLYMGPSAPSRIVAFDLIAIHAVGILALFAVRNNEEVLLDAAIVTAVLGFLGTVMMSYFLEKSDGADWRDARDD
jgi:multicomponent Na+:H+ antiporter subunit F